jgi:hypothetical protein
MVLFIAASGLTTDETTVWPFAQPRQFCIVAPLIPERNIAYDLFNFNSLPADRRLQTTDAGATWAGIDGRTRPASDIPGIGYRRSK